MKKITLVLVALLIAMPLLAGDADNASLDLEGNATTTFGVDLDSGATGFQNSVTAKIEFHFNLPTTSLHSGSEEAPIYGEILLDEILLETVDSADSSEVYWDVDVAVDYAKIMGPNWWISLVGPDNSMDFVDSPRDDHLGIATGTYGAGMDMLNYAQSSSGGFEAAYTVDGVGTVGASIFSLNDWNDTSDDKNAYGATVEFSLSAVDNLTFDLGAGMGFGAAEASTLKDAITAGTKVGYKVMLGDTYYVQPIVAFDLLLDGDAMSYEVGNGLLIGIGGANIANSDSTISYRTAAGAGDAMTEVAFEDDTAAGIALMWDYYQGPEVGGVAPDGILDIYAEAGITVIENVEIALGFGIDDAMAEVPAMGFGTYLSYTMGSAFIDAGFVMKMDNEADGGSQDGLTVANFGISITDFIPLVDLHIDWWSGNLAADTGEEADLGIVKVAFSLDY